MFYFDVHTHSVGRFPASEIVSLNVDSGFIASEIVYASVGIHPWFLSEMEDYMKEKRVFYSELAYVIGIIVLAFGTALLEKADFGMSMIVAPAYLLHLKISPYIPFFSFGVAEYVFQGFLLVLLSIVLRKIKFLFFLSFVTAFIYGNILNLFLS